MCLGVLCIGMVGRCRRHASVSCVTWGCSEDDVSLSWGLIRPHQVRLPYAVQPDTASARANAHEGVMIVSLSVDPSPPSLRADAGSKPWLLSHALGGGQKRPAAGGEGGFGKLKGNAGSGTLEGASADDGVGGTDELPEDRFHLRLPKGNAGAV